MYNFVYMVDYWTVYLNNRFIIVVIIKILPLEKSSDRNQKSLQLTALPNWQYNERDNVNAQ